MTDLRTPTVRAPQQRFVELDGLRGIAAVAVVVYHFTASHNVRYPGDPRSVVEFAVGEFGVHLFFFISGFVILMTAGRARRVSDFAISRVSRLYPVYWIALTVSLILSVVFAIPGTGIAWADRIANYTMVQRLLLFDNVDEVYWTLAIEMQFYILIAALLVVTHCHLTTRRVVVFGALWCSVCTVAALIVWPYTQGVAPQFVWAPVKMVINLILVEWGPYFVTGMFAYLGRADRRMRIPAVTTMLLAVGISTLLHTYEYGAVVLVLGSVFLFVAFAPRTPPLRWAPVQFYGRISYSLYICHNFVGALIIHWTAEAIGRTAAMVLAFAVVTAYAVLLQRVGEQMLSAVAKRGLLSARASVDSRRRRRLA